MDDSTHRDVLRRKSWWATINIVIILQTSTTARCEKHNMESDIRNSSAISVKKSNLGWGVGGIHAVIQPNIGWYIRPYEQNAKFCTNLSLIDLDQDGLPLAVVNHNSSLLRVDSLFNCYC